MKNYRSRVEADRCETCEHCFIRYEYEEANEYYCQYGEANRPLCMSAAMSETGNSLTCSETFSKLYEKWNEWSEKREVERTGICDNYVKE